MPEIEFINIPTIPRIPTIKIDKQTSLPVVPHVTRQLPPVFDMPCTTIRTDGTKNNQLFIDDPKGNATICPMPFYEPLNYNAKDIVPIEEQKPPTPSTPPTPKEPETPIRECRKAMKKQNELYEASLASKRLNYEMSRAKTCFDNLKLGFRFKPDSVMGKLCSDIELITPPNTEHTHKLK